MGRPKKVEGFKVTLDLGGEKFEAVAPTILDALNKFDMPKFLRGKGFLTAEKEGKKFTKYLPVFAARRLASNLNAREVTAKMLTIYFK